MDASSNQLTGWHAFLSQAGARHADDPNAGVIDFGDAAPTAAGPLLSDLSHYGLIRIQGEDAPSFLDAQCSVGLKALPTDQSRRGAWCNAKGRVRTLFRVFSSGGHLYLRMPASMVQQTIRGLQLYILRSRVVLTDVGTEAVRIGLAGPGSAELIRDYFGSSPQPDRAINAQGMLVLGSAADLFEVYCFGDEALRTAEQFWRRAAPESSLIGSDAWRRLRIERGLPEVYPQTSEVFLPHWLDLDLTGAVDFVKGCYPGQEVVARMQHRGQTKQRLFRAASSGPTQPGMGLYAGTDDAKRIGTVIDAAPADDGGHELLAALRLDAADGPALHVADDRANRLTDVVRANPDPD